MFRFASIPKPQPLSSLLTFRQHSLRHDIESFIYGNFEKVPVLEFKINNGNNSESYTVSISFLNKNNIASQIEQLYIDKNIPLHKDIMRIRVLFHDTIPCTEKLFFVGQQQ